MFGPTGLARLSVVVALINAGQSFHVAPAYFPDGLTGTAVFEAVLANMAISGLANRLKPNLWLNASSTSWESGVPVNWPYPEADPIWIDYMKGTTGEDATVLDDAKLCTLLRVPAASRAVKGIILYETSATIDALAWIAATAAGQYSGIPVTRDLLAASPCLKNLPILFEVPSATSFSNNLNAYKWMHSWLANETAGEALPVMVGACRSWANYTCAWSDPLGAAAIDYGISRGGLILNLDPSSTEQAMMLSALSGLIKNMGIVTGWMEPEDKFVEVVSAAGLIVQCGAPNLAFFRALNVNSTAKQLPYHRSSEKAAQNYDPSKQYVVFMSNEGDTPKNAYSFRAGNWLNPLRGSIPVAWGVSPIIAEEFPGLWDYYVNTANSTDSFFGATGGVGYTHPWHFSNMTELGLKGRELFKQFMPVGSHNWIDNWENACPGSDTNPCTDAYQKFKDLFNGSVAGFSQSPTSPLSQKYPNWVTQAWTMDGTPIILQADSLFYPSDTGPKPLCNKTEPEATACIESRIQSISPKSTPFVLAYGAPDYVTVAANVRDKFADRGIVVIGAQDLAAIAWQAGPRR